MYIYIYLKNIYQPLLTNDNPLANLHALNNPLTLVTWVSPGSATPCGIAAPQFWWTPPGPPPDRGFVLDFMNFMMDKYG